MSGAVYFSEVEVGEMVGELAITPTSVQLFRYSAATWNAHRIHYDRPYAESEGYPGVLVQSHLHGAFLARLCTDWMGESGRLASLEVSVRRHAVAGERLVCRGRVAKKETAGDEGLATVALEEVKESGEICAVGEAMIALPLERSVSGR